MSSQLSTFTKLFISFTFFRSSTLVRTATWTQSASASAATWRGFRDRFHARADLGTFAAWQNANEMVTSLR